MKVSRQKKIKVSIISVCLNDLPGLIATCQSIQSQSIQRMHFEHIVIDGGSRSETVEYLKRYSAETGSQFISEKDDGIYFGMNKGISIATGEILWFLNAGDTLASKYSIEILSDYLEEPENQWGYGITSNFDLSGGFAGLAFPFPFSITNQSIGISFVPHPSAFVGSSLMKEIGGFNTAIPIAADQVLLTQAAFIKPPIIVPFVLTNFVKGGISSNISNTEARRQLQQGLMNSKYANLSPNRWTTYKALIKHKLKITARKMFF